MVGEFIGEPADPVELAFVGVGSQSGQLCLEPSVAVGFQAAASAGVEVVGDEHGPRVGEFAVEVGLEALRAAAPALRHLPARSRL